MDYGFEYVEAHGIVLEKDYKYTARDGTCKTNTGAFKNKSHKDVPRGDVNALAAAVTV